MLSKNDLKQITELFDAGFKKNFRAMWEEYILPGFVSLDEKIDTVENNLEAKISQLPTKEYLDEKLASYRSSWNKKT